jgi:hypothetical protein
MGVPNFRKSRDEWPPAAGAIRLVCMQCVAWQQQEAPAAALHLWKKEGRAMGNGQRAGVTETRVSVRSAVDT